MKRILAMLTVLLVLAFSIMPAVGAAGQTEERHSLTETVSVADATTEAEQIASEKDGLNTRAVTVWIVAVCSLITIADIIFTVRIAKRNKNN